MLLSVMHSFVDCCCSDAALAPLVQQRLLVCVTAQHGDDTGMLLLGAPPVLSSVTVLLYGVPATTSSPASSGSAAPPILPHKGLGKPFHSPLKRPASAAGACIITVVGPRITTTAAAVSPATPVTAPASTDTPTAAPEDMAAKRPRDDTAPFVLHSRLDVAVPGSVGASQQALRDERRTVEHSAKTLRDRLRTLQLVRTYRSKNNLAQARDTWRVMQY